jgi:hypothetical protein
MPIEKRQPFTSDECQKANEMVYDPLSFDDQNFLTSAIKALSEGRLDQFMAEYERNKKPVIEKKNPELEAKLAQIADELKQVLRR